MTFPYDGTGFAPVRKFFIGTSDYADRVIKWPTISRTTNQLKATQVSIELANADMAFNNYYANLYTMVNTCDLWIDSHHLFNGQIEEVQYNDQKCIIRAKDKAYKFGDITMGIVPSELIPYAGFPNYDYPTGNPAYLGWWILDYLDFDDSEAEYNHDIDWTAWGLWKDGFEVNGITIAAEYRGEKLSDCFQQLADMTNSDIWVTREGKIKFKHRIDVASNDVLITNDYVINLDITIAKNKVITQQYVYGDYDYDTDEWAIKAYSQDATNTNSYGLHSDTISNPTCWYTSSVDAIVLAQKRIIQYKQPPREITIKCPLALIDTTISDRVRLVSSFFSITSESTWRVTAEKIDMNNGTIEFDLDGSRSFEPFFLDVDYLDGPKLLL